MDEKIKQELIEFMIVSGKRLLQEQGTLPDIGVKKQYLTEEDICIERGIKDIVCKMSGKQELFAEEENDNFVNGNSVWIVDPISGTKIFIGGGKNYAIVASHMSCGKVDFASVYNPSSDKMYMATKGNVSINGLKIEREKKKNKKIIFAPSYGWKDREQVERIEQRLKEYYEVFPSQGSFAINYCFATEGQFAGVVSLTKDAFPEFAGLFIANEAGLNATNIKGEKDISPNDRVFVCGDEEDYDKLIQIVKEELNLEGK